MPYKIVKVENGYKVAKKDGSKMKNGRTYTSNKPMTYKNAKDQIKAMEINEK